ncbi:MAG: DUF1015 domain-containing protein [Candidatus Acidiferrales bacterium]
MARIFPFQAYRYNPARVKLEDVVTQPYDKISPAMQDRYYATSPYNLISVEKGKTRPDDSATNNVYTRAARTLEEWIASGVLLREPVASLYVYIQKYKAPGESTERTRKGLIAIGQIEDYSAGVIFRHEQTLSGPKADRLELLRHTKTHTGQLFMLYTDPARRVDAQLDKISQAPPTAEARDDLEVLHQLWAITDPALIQSITGELADKKLAIADGHHRYETALAYRDECRAKSGSPIRAERVASKDRSAPYERVMMTLFNTAGEGLIVLPTHRVVSRLADFSFERFRDRVKDEFDCRSYSFSAGPARTAAFSMFLSHLEQSDAERPSIGAFAGGDAFHLFTLRADANLNALLPDVSVMQRRLDVVLLHKLLIERGLGITAEAVKGERNLTYERDMEAAIDAVDRGEAQLCFLLNAISAEQTAQIAFAGEVLPQKSTDFYPKLLSGLTLYRLE